MLQKHWKTKNRRIWYEVQNLHDLKRKEENKITNSPRVRKCTF